MALMDFLFGKQGQEGQLEPNVRAARDFLLDQLLAQYSAGPVNIPQYMAVAPAAQYSGTNALLSSLGLEGVSAPSMPTTNIGGMEVYTSAPVQTQMESDFAEKYPGLYDYMRSFYMDPVTGEFGERSYGYVDPMATQTVAPTGGGGGGNDDDPLELHYSLFPNERPRTGPYADPKKPSGITYKGDYPTMGSMPSIRGYTTPDRGVVGNFFDDLKSAGSQIKRDLGGLFGRG